MLPGQYTLNCVAVIVSSASGDEGWKVEPCGVALGAVKTGDCYVATA
jgi:hypothetical protein